MKKYLTFLASLTLILVGFSSKAQNCCSVVSGSGGSVVSSSGVCVVAPSVDGYMSCSNVDTDGDGIADSMDFCPREPGPKTNNGCPELLEAELAVLSAAIEGVNFVFGKAELTEESKPRLHEVALLLERHPDFRIKISGYTDNIDTKEFNQKLSEERAKACRDYLVQDGIDASRIDYAGYGESNPVADNSTEEGRAKNRRVEFEVTFSRYIITTS